MANKNYFMNGTTEFLILSLLEKKDMYVYEIVKSLRDFSDNCLDISQNTVYTATYKLESDDMITEYSKRVGRKRTRVYYHIEPKGLTYLKEIREVYFNHIKGIGNILDAINNNN